MARVRKPRMAYSDFLREGDRRATDETLERLSRALRLGLALRRVIRHISQPKIFVTAEGSLPDIVSDDVVAAAQQAGFRLRLPHSEEEVGTQSWECTGMGGTGEEVTFVIRLFPSVATPVPTR